MNAKVFVGNLNFGTTSDELEELFAQAGEVAGVSVPTDRETGRPRGFAFVEFKNSEDAAAAIQRFDGHELAGRKLRVNEANERPPQDRERSGGFGGGRPFGGGGGGGGRGPGKPKGSRRNIRGRKRSIE